MNFDIFTLCCNFLFIITSSSLFKSKTKKKLDVSKNVPRRHFLLIVIVIAIMLIYKDLSVFSRNVLKMWTRITPNTDTFFAGKEFFKRQKMSKMRLRINFVKLLIFRLFSKVI